MIKNYYCRGAVIMEEQISNTVITNESSVQSKRLGQTIPSYSFIEDFKNYNLLKKFLVIIFLPLVPIYSISKYFQIKGQQKGKTPNIFKYIIILTFLYILTAYPLIFSVFWLSLQVFLFPISFLIALYLHKFAFKAKQQEEYKQKDPFVFEVIKFPKKSKTFIFLLIIALLGSYSGLFFIFTFRALLFIAFPKLYKRLFGFVSKVGLLLSHSVFGILSYIPGVNFKGRWFIEQGSEMRPLRSVKDLLQFIINNWTTFFLLNAGIICLLLRIVYFLRGDPPVSQQTFINDLASNTQLLIVFSLKQIIMAIYFTWVWVWRDAELKIAITKKSTKGVTPIGEPVVETEELFHASSSIANLFGIAFGIPSIAWLAGIYAESFKQNTGQFYFGYSILVIIIILFIWFTSGIVIFMGVMYYRSGVHEELVNDLRQYIKRNYQKGEETDKDLPIIAYSNVKPLSL